MFQQNLFFLFSKFDNELRRDKTVSGMREKLRKGYVCGAIPFGYDNLNPGKGKTPQLVINKDGKLLQKAFELKAKLDLSHTEITRRIKKLGWTRNDKKLSDYFRNPVYCGVIVSSVIPGEVIEGKHPAITTKEIFLEVNGLLSKKNHGDRYGKKDHMLPLKQFMIADTCGTSYTGYLVKKKNLYYYKNNRKGSKENRRAELMHNLFYEKLKEYELSQEAIGEPMQKLVFAVLTKLQEDSIELMIGLEQQLNDLKNNLGKIEKRFALGEIDRELYVKYRDEFDKAVEDIKDEIGNSHFNLSNLEMATENAVNRALNLSEMWASGNLEEKRRIQKLLFPEGIAYNHKNHVYRTIRVNVLFATIAVILRDSEQNKNGKNSNQLNFSRLVPKAGIEPALFRTRV
ncbi:MAG: recombinase family protein [Bacteroidetes bacterium]|nr:recombinase family protein [Bacteroidota bacterium]